MRCQYCRKPIKKLVVFHLTCSKCEQELVDVHMPYIDQMDQYRKIIADCEAKISILSKEQDKATNEKSNEMLGWIDSEKADE